MILADISYDTIIVAVVVSVVAPSILAIGNARQNRKNKQQDWAHQAKVETDRIAREDQVAAKAQQAAETLAERTREGAARAEAAASKAADVAKQAAVVAQDLLRAQAETISRTNEVARLAAESAATTDSKLNDLAAVAALTHSLVNSEMTIARAAELDGLETSLHLLRRVVALGEAHGIAPEPDDLAAIEIKVARVVELKDMLVERRKQQQAVDAEIAEGVKTAAGKAP